MSVLQQLIAALPVVAASWQAVTGYVVVTLAFVVVSLKVTRNRNVLNKLKSLPEKDRARVLEMEMGAAYLATGLSPEQWLRQQRQQYVLVGFLAVCFLGVALILAAMLSGQAPDPRDARLKAETLAKEFLAKLESNKFEQAYDLFPDDVRKNIGFAQFKADIDRLLFQLPGPPLKDSVEQSVENGAILSVMVASEFSIETKIRHVVGFARDANGWKLWQYNWQPVDWPMIWPTSTVIRQSASETMKAYRALNDSERVDSLPEKLRGNITGSSPGWRLIVNSTSAERDDSRCTVTATEADSSTLVELKHVVGGCKLSQSTPIIVNAILSGVTDSRIELDGVRYFPTN